MTRKGLTAMQPKWLEWAQRLQAVAQTGLTYAKDPFDVERYEAMRELAAEIVATHAGLEAPNVLDVFADQAGYATPKLDVRGVVFQNGKLLMVRERDDGKWTLPGGWADVGDSPREAVEREIREESGYETHAVKLLAVVDRLKQGPVAAHEQPPSHPTPCSHRRFRHFRSCCSLDPGRPRASQPV